MSKAHRTIITGLVIGILAAAGTYFINTRITLSCNPYPVIIDNASYIKEEAGTMPSLPYTVERGYPKSYYQKEAILGSGQCYSTTYRTHINLYNLLFDLAAWTAVGIVLSACIYELRRRHI